MLAGYAAAASSATMRPFSHLFARARQTSVAPLAPSLRASSDQCSPLPEMCVTRSRDALPPATTKASSSVFVFFV